MAVPAEGTPRLVTDRAITGDVMSRIPGGLCCAALPLAEVVRTHHAVADRSSTRNAIRAFIPTRPGQMRQLAAIETFSW
jgi:hypothetical protein